MSSILHTLVTHHYTIVVLRLAGEPFAEEGGSSEAHEKVSVDNQVIKVENQNISLVCFFSLVARLSLFHLRHMAIDTVSRDKN